MNYDIIVQTMHRLNVVLSLCVVLRYIGSIELYWNTCSIEMGVWGIEMTTMLYWGSIEVVLEDTMKYWCNIQVVLK